jgi:hypothetical protein
MLLDIQDGGTTRSCNTQEGQLVGSAMMSCEEEKENLHNPKLPTQLNYQYWVAHPFVMVVRECRLLYVLRLEVRTEWCCTYKKATSISSIMLHTEAYYEDHSQPANHHVCSVKLLAPAALHAAQHFKIPKSALVALTSLASAAADK